jgi:hypothetical protein
MNEVIKKHQYLLELTKNTFQGELEPIGLELFQKLQLFSSFLNTYGQKEWRIEIKAKNGKARFVFEEQQVVLQMLIGIESVMANMPDVSTERKLQKHIFKLSAPFYEECTLIDKTFLISRIDEFLMDFFEVQFGQHIPHRSFEKWYKLIYKKAE